MSCDPAGHVTRLLYLISRAHWEVLHRGDQPLGDQLTIGGRGFPPQKLRLHTGELSLEGPAGECRGFVYTRLFASYLSQDPKFKTR